MDVAVDTETTGFEWWAGRQPFLVQWATDAAPRGEHAYLGPARPLELTASEKRALADRAWRDIRDADRIVGHNLPFDIHHLDWHHNWKLGSADRLLDTRLLAQITLPERRFAKEEDGRGYHLKDLSQTYVDPDAKDGEEELERLALEHGFRLKAKPGAKDYRDAAYFELWRLEPDAVEFYAREDARLTLGLLGKLEPRLTSKTRVIWDLEQRVMPIVVGAEAKGISVDTDKVAPLRAEYTAQADETRDILDKELMEGWSDNNEALGEALVKAGVPLTETTDNGQLATNKWALERLSDDHPIIQTLFDYRMASKFVSTYLDHFTDEIIHPTFDQIGTWTGRMAGRQPNMQNIPVRAGKQVRELFIPRPGHAFVGIDFEQIEFRLLCYYLNGRRMVELMEAGHDPFAQLAADVYGGDASQYRKGAPLEAKRTTTKNTTYAIVYGAGGMKVAKMLGWRADSVYTPADWVVKNGYKKAGEPRSKAAEQLIKRIKSALTGYGAPSYRGKGSGSGLMGKIHDQVAELGYVNTIMGRYQWLGYDKAYKGLSGLIQGGAADIYKLALIEATAAVKPLGAYPLLFIHDEILFETPIGSEAEVLRVGSEAMTNAYPMRPTLEVEGHIAYNNWSETK